MSGFNLDELLAPVQSAIHLTTQEFDDSNIPAGAGTGRAAGAGGIELGVRPADAGSRQLEVLLLDHIVLSATDQYFPGRIADRHYVNFKNAAMASLLDWDLGLPHCSDFKKLTEDFQALDKALSGKIEQLTQRANKAGSKSTELDQKRLYLIDKQAALRALIINSQIQVFPPVPDAYGLKRQRRAFFEVATIKLGDRVGDFARWNQALCNQMSQAREAQILRLHADPALKPQLKRWIEFFEKASAEQIQDFLLKEQHIIGHTQFNRSHLHLAGRHGSSNLFLPGQSAASRGCGLGSPYVRSPVIELLNKASCWTSDLQSRVNGALLEKPEPVAPPASPTPAITFGGLGVGGLPPVFEGDVLEPSKKTTHPTAP